MKRADLICNRHCSNCAEETGAETGAGVLKGKAGSAGLGRVVRVWAWSMGWSDASNRMARAGFRNCMGHPQALCEIVSGRQCEWEHSIFLGEVCYDEGCGEGSASLCVGWERCAD